MDLKAASALKRLLERGERHQVGARKRRPSLHKADLAFYRGTRALSEKEAIEATFEAAQAQGAVEIEWDGRPGTDRGLVKQVALVDPGRLARFLDVTPASIHRAHAEDLLRQHVPSFPVLNQVLEHWGAFKTVRKTGPADATLWAEAANAIILLQADPAGAEGYRPLRVVSAHIAKDSKRLEQLTPFLDVLLSGSLNARPRPPHEVWSELGLCKEEQPARLAGRVRIVRDRVTALLDAPYGALPLAAIRGVDPTSPPAEVLTIENLTTFHQEAKRRCEAASLVIYTGGAPSPAWRAMYARILGSLPTRIPIKHWGDVDEGGYRIASQIAQVVRANGFELEPYLMHPEDVPPQHRQPAKPQTLERMRYFAAAAGWRDIADAIDLEHGFTVEQEALDLE